MALKKPANQSSASQWSVLDFNPWSSDPIPSGPLEYPVSDRLILGGLIKHTRQKNFYIHSRTARKDKFGIGIIFQNIIHPVIIPFDIYILIGIHNIYHIIRNFRLFFLWDPGKAIN